MKFSKKVLVVLLLISIVPIMITGFIYNGGITKEIDDKINVFYKHIIDQSATTIEHEIDDLENSMGSLLANSIIQQALLDYTKKTGIEKVDSQRQISQLIGSILYLNENIESIAFLFDEGENFLLYGDTTPSYVNYLMHELNREASLGQTDITWQYDGNTNQFLLSRTFLHMNSGEYIGDILFFVNPEYFNQVIENSNTNSGELIYLLAPQGRLVSGTLEGGNPQASHFIHNVYDQLMQQSGVLKEDVSLRSGIEFIGKEDAIIYSLLHNGFFLVSEVNLNTLSSDLRAGRSTILSVGCVCVILALLISIIFSKYIGVKFLKLKTNMLAVQKGFFDIEKPKENHGDEFLELDTFFYEMSQQLKVLIDKTYIQEIENKEAKLNALQNQINPHFLFNTFEIIRAMSVSGENEEIEEVISRLGRLYQYNLSEINIEFTSVEDELAHIRNYVYLMNIHYNDKVILFVDCEEELKYKKIPRFIFQPIVENSIIHGLKNRKEALVIEIGIILNQDTLTIRISDDGVGITPEAILKLQTKINSPTDSRGSIGLKNVSQRIDLAYGNPYGIYLNGEIGRFTVDILLPDQPLDNNGAL